MLVALVAIGCSSNGNEPEVSPPKKGDKVILKGIYDVWADLTAYRKSRAIWAAYWSRHGTEQTPEERADLKDLDARRPGTVFIGDLVEVIEVGKDYAAIQVLSGTTPRAGFGSRLYGYVEPWREKL
jgi:hypothetical protein